MIVLDLAAAAYAGVQGPAVLDTAIEVAAGIAHTVLRASSDLTLLGTTDRRLPVGPLRGTGSVGEVLEVLATIIADGRLLLGPWLQD